MSKTGYSSISSSFICTTCKHGQVMEDESGHSLVLCRVGEGTDPFLVPMIVTKCSSHERKELGRIWDNAMSLSLIDKSLWMEETERVRAPGSGDPFYGHIRADTFHSNRWVVREFPGMIYDRLTQTWEKAEEKE